MNPAAPSPETRAAIDAVRAALAVASARTGAQERIGKDWVDFSTGADLAAEDAIRETLGSALAIVGEERGGETPADGAPYWLVDPICGTRNYAAEIPLYCCNLALVERGRVTLAVVGDGSTGRIAVAERGQGAYRCEGDARIPLSVRTGAIIDVELGGKPPSRADAEQFGHVVAELSTDGAHEVRHLATTLAFARLASGDLAGLIFLGRISHPLHTAAGCLVAEEAGAILTDLAGEPWTLETRGFVGAASLALHAELLALASARR